MYRRAGALFSCTLCQLAASWHNLSVGILQVLLSTIHDSIATSLPIAEYGIMHGQGGPDGRLTGIRLRGSV